MHRSAVLLVPIVIQRKLVFKIHDFRKVVPNFSAYSTSYLNGDSEVKAKNIIAVVMLRLCKKYQSFVYCNIVCPQSSLWNILNFRKKLSANRYFKSRLKDFFVLFNSHSLVVLFSIQHFVDHCFSPIVFRGLKVWVNFVRDCGQC